MTDRIATSPLSGRIHAGRVNKAGNAFVGGKRDVTSDVLLAVIEKAEFHGGMFDIDGGNRKWFVTVTEVTDRTCGGQASGESIAGGKGPDHELDAARWRALCRSFGNERDEATPGKLHDILIRLDADGCEVRNQDGSLNFAATLAAIMDDEARIQARADGVNPVEGEEQK